jgi:hypothetical protein
MHAFATDKGRTEGQLASVFQRLDFFLARPMSTEAAGFINAVFLSF